MGPHTYTITSPVMGTFYRASAPGEKPLVEVGQKVNAADVVCMIESMKIFTELRADQPGTVTALNLMGSRAGYRLCALTGEVQPTDQRCANAQGFSLRAGLGILDRPISGKSALFWA